MSLNRIGQSDVARTKWRRSHDTSTATIQCLYLMDLGELVMSLSWPAYPSEPASWPSAQMREMKTRGEIVTSYISINLFVARSGLVIPYTKMSKSDPEKIYSRKCTKRIDKGDNARW